MTAICDIARYKIDELKSGSLAKYSLRLWKAVSHLFVHWKAYLKVFKKGRHLLVALETNLFKAAICPVNLCTSFIVLGEAILSIVFTFFEFTSIPH